MKAKLIEHSASILLVALAFGIFGALVMEKEASLRTARAKMIEPYLHLDFIDFGNPLHRTLFKETLDIFHPERIAGNDSLLQAIQRFHQEQFASLIYKTGREERGLSSARILTLGTMYGQFMIIYLIVMVLSYHAAQSLAIVRFVKMMQHQPSNILALYEQIVRLRHKPLDFSSYFRVLIILGRIFVRGMSYSVLFAPAYVIAYSIRSGYDADSYLFMIVLGVISNGLLITYANKFYTFLVTESRKGYIQTALVKNLDSSYDWATPDGVAYAAVLRPKSLFPSHVFRHIYMNARYQYLPSLKEHASFLITGLIIIEMALNIQGQLGYELLQNILYRQYDVAMAIIVGIFLIVKTTEIVVDVWVHHESGKYENRE